MQNGQPPGREVGALGIPEPAGLVESPRPPLRPARVAAAAALSLLALGMLAGSAFTAVHAWQLSHDGRTAAGVVRTLHEHEATLAVTYPDGSVRTEQATVDTALDVGSNVQLKYLPGHPGDVMVSGSATVWFPAGALLIGGSLVLAMARGQWRERKPLRVRGRNAPDEEEPRGSAPQPTRHVPRHARHTEA